MKRCALVLVLPVLAAGLLLTGCSGKGSDGKGASGDGKGTPVFTLAWSEYPSWSVFGVASEMGLIDGRKGHMGELEKKWGVDIELNSADYGPTIDFYKGGTVDAVCITN